MLENQDIHVDCITTDGATWNRSMWKLFGRNLPAVYIH